LLACLGQGDFGSVAGLVAVNGAGRLAVSGFEV
jgi:hypothetical protein